MKPLRNEKRGTLSPPLGLIRIAVELLDGHLAGELRIMSYAFVEMGVPPPTVAELPLLRRAEAMHGLGIPTTRALSLISTGDDVVRDCAGGLRGERPPRASATVPPLRPPVSGGAMSPSVGDRSRAIAEAAHPVPPGGSRLERGAVVCRVAPSFLRFGHFEHFEAPAREIPRPHPRLSRPVARKWLSPASCWSTVRAPSPPGTPASSPVGPEDPGSRCVENRPRPEAREETDELRMLTVHALQRHFPEIHADSASV